jgi:hypothetical protein
MARLRPLLPLLALLAWAGSPAAAHAAAGPVAAYGFEETSTTTVADDSGNGHSGTILGGAVHVTGHNGTALSFDGVNERVSIPDSPAFAMTTALTLEAWVKPVATAGWHTAVLKERPGDLSYALYGSGPDKPNGQVFSGGYGQATAPSATPANTWSHIAMTFNGTAVKVFVNGAQVASTNFNGTITNGSGPLDIGGNSVWGEWFNGVIDDVRVYNRALTAAEITTDMNTPVGNGAPPPPPPGPDTIGSWTAPQNWPMVAVHTSMLSNGKVVAWDAFSAAPGSEHVWDPATGQFQSTPSGINLFCAGHVLLPDGRLFTAGGHELAYVGIRNTALFNPLTASWTAGPDMARGRWYPTTTTLPDGRILIVSGDAIQTTPFGPYNAFYAPSDTIPEIYNPATNTIQSVPAGARRMPLYPFMFVAPDGRVVDAGPDKTTRLFDPATGTWATLASQSPIDGHSAVMYRPGKILKSGTWTDPDFPNTVPITNRAAVLDMDQAVPAWREVSPMHHARTFQTLTVLPDGDVLALAGQSKAGSMSVTTDPVLEPEIWHPATDTWTPMAESQIPRGYHNTSLLLPDGRILLAGSGRLDGSMMPNEANAEIFSPPYLNKGPRPTISYAPPTMSYGGKITLVTPDASNVAKVSLVRTGAVTHNFNMDQRWAELTFRKVGNDIEVDAPAGPNAAPPGVYYVFIMNANGVPSKAAILSISGSAPADTQAPSVPSGVSAVGSVGKVVLNWTASTDNVGVVRYSVYRSTTSGFTPGASNLVGTATGTTFTDAGLAAGTYFYRVIAEDQAGNKSAASSEASGTALADTTAPTVSMTAPAAGPVSGSVTVSANAADDVGVASVQFRLDNADLGAPDTSSPYSTTWNTTSATAGPHTLTAIAKDAANNATTATTVSVTVDNSAPAGPTPVAAYSFENGSGTSLTDTTGKGHTGTIREATWTTTGKNGGALRFDGVNDWVTIADSADLRLSAGMTLEAWVNPTNNTGWRTAILKERTGDLAYALYAGGATTPLATITNTSLGGYGEAAGPAGSAPATNTWTHLAATYDGTTLRLFKNGTQIASSPRAGTIFAGTGPLRLGGNNLWAEWFVGQLDDVRIYDQALTATQIQTDMNTPAG